MQKGPRAASLSEVCLMVVSLTRRGNAEKVQFNNVRWSKLPYLPSS